MQSFSFTIDTILSITKGKAIFSNNENSEISEILTDSRQIGKTENTLFVAIKTEKNNGHNYIIDLMEKGITNFIVSSVDFITLKQNKYDTNKNFNSCNFILVTDTVDALQQIATAYRQSLNYPVIGITGSNGKTVVKEWLWQLLSPIINISRSPKSYNSQIGVPLSILKMNKDSDLGIIEAGISKQKEMEKIASIVSPNIGILTNIGNAHSENFEDKKDILKEKIKLFQSCETIIFRDDDDEITRTMNRCYPDKNLINWKMKDILELLQPIKLNDYLNNDACLENLGTCLTTLKVLHYNVEDFLKNLNSLIPVEMRLEIKKGINNCIILNDSYSLDIVSFSVAIDMLMQQQRFVKKTVILSDFASIKDEYTEYQMYAKIAEIINNKKITRTILIGNVINSYKSLFKNNVEYYYDTQSFYKKINILNFKEEAILIKGARTFQLENLSNMLQLQEHETILEVNLEAITYNIEQFRKKIPKGTKILAMLKAFSYGIGSSEIANLLQSNNIDYIAVAFVDEGIELREAGINSKIVVMNPEENALLSMFRHNLEPEIYSFNRLSQVISELKKFSESELPYDIHIKIDTGMHRLGFEEEEIDSLLDIINDNKNIIRIASIFSHLSCADNYKMDDFSISQVTKFEEITKKMCKKLRYKPLLHILNSFGAARFPQYSMDMIRLGIGLYGADQNLCKQLNLLPALQLKTIISQIKNVKKGDSIGYGNTWVAKENSKIAILPIGYADGLKTSLSNNAFVFVKGEKAPIIGRISMDMCYIDVSNLDAIKEGDEVEIFGKSISINEIADFANTNVYEIISTLSHRIKRVYYN